MDDSTKKSIKLGIFIILMCFFAVAIFLMGMLKKGTLVFYGEEPFKVTISFDDPVNCETSPCKMRVKTGEQRILLEKSGHRNIFLEEEIKLWRTIKIDLDFYPIPKLMGADRVPNQEEKFKYEIVKERQTGRQKLVKATDPQKTAIIYFQKTLKSPKILGESRFIIISDEEVMYKIDTENKTRKEIKGLDINKITETKWSMDGKFMLFKESESDNLWIFDDEKEEKIMLSVLGDIDIFDWIYDNKLVFVTNQPFRTTRGNDDDGNLYVDFLEGINQNGYTIGFYYPKLKRYSKLDMLERIEEGPEEIMALANGKELYMKIDGEDFKITLKKL